MTQREKTLRRMRLNPRDDWSIDDLKAIADRYGIPYDHDGSSHVQFRFPGVGRVPIPAARPVKPRYIKQFVGYIDSLRSLKNSR